MLIKIFLIPFLVFFSFNKIKAIEFQEDKSAAALTDQNPLDVQDSSPLGRLKERIFQDSWEYSTGNLDYYRSFLEPFYEKILGTNIPDVREKRSRLLDTSHSVFLQLEMNPSNSLQGIPKNTHKVWITSNDSPHEVPMERLTQYFESLDILQGQDWDHTFWCIDKTKIPTTIEAIQRSGKNIHIRDLNEIMPQIRGKSILTRMYDNKYFTAVSDIIRFNLLHLIGGIYSDFGVIFNYDLSPFLSHFDYLFGQEGFLAGTSFIGARANSSVYNALLSFIDTLDRLPIEFRDWGNHILTPRWTALGGLTAMIDGYTLESDRILPIPYGEDSLVKTNHMGSWLGTTPQFGQVSLQQRPISKSVFFGETTIFDKSYRYDLSADPMSQFIITLAEKLYKTSFETLQRNRAQMVEASKQIFYNVRAALLNEIPHIHHRSWITDPDFPVEAPQDKLQMYVDSLKVFNPASDWRYIFWCLNPSQIPETIQFLKDSRLPIEIRSLSEITAHMSGRAIFEAMVKDKRFCNANDITRLHILYLYGGLYSDLGFTFHRDLTPLIDIYQRIFLLYDWGNIDHNFIAVKRHDPILKHHLDRLDRLHLLPEEIKSLTPDSSSQMIWTGSHHFMTLLDVFGKEDKTLFLPSDGTYITQVRGQSWGKDAKFGNKPITKSALDIFRVVQGKSSTSEKKVRVYCSQWVNPYSDYTVAMNGLDWTYIGDFLRSEQLKAVIPNGHIVSSPLALRKGDIFLIDAPNVLHQWHCEWADSLEKELTDVDPETRVIITTIGLHSSDLQQNIGIHPSSLKFLRTLLQRSSGIGVSGSHTSHQLETERIKTFSLGTPSLLNLHLHEQLLEKKEKVRKLAITAAFDSLNPLTQHALLSFGVNHQATYIALSEKELLKWPTFISSWEIVEHLKSFSEEKSLNWEQTTLYHRFKEATSDQGLSKEMVEIGIKEGYFHDFIDLIRRNITSPRNLKHWISLAADHDLIISSRLEGVIAGILSGTRSLCVAHDSYTEETCRAMGLPFIKLLNPLMTLEEAYDLADPSNFILNYPVYRERYLSFFKENGIPVKDSSSPLSDRLILKAQSIQLNQRKVFCERWTFEPYNDFSGFQRNEISWEWNIGEYLFAAGAKSLFPSLNIVNDRRLLMKGDTYLIVASNVLSPFKASWAEHILKNLEVVRPEVSVVVLCMGAQSPRTDIDTDIHPITLSLLRQIAKRSQSIGVRGTYTQLQLKRYGIQSRVVGCPSLFFKPLLIDRLIHPKGKIEKIAFGATMYSDNPLLQHELLAFGAAHCATYIIQTEKEFLEWQKLQSPEEIIERLENFVKDQTVLTDEQKALRTRYLESKPDHEKFKLLERKGVRPSYFKDFAEIVRTKGVLPNNLENWVTRMGEFDLVVSSRIHGVVAGILGGTRSLCIAHDSRTEELCQTLKVPFVKEFDPSWSVQKIYDLADSGSFVRNYNAYRANYLDFLRENQLPTCLP